jgi:hypothetical protein
MERLLCTKAAPLIEKARKEKIAVDDVWELDPE